MNFVQNVSMKALIIKCTVKISIAKKMHYNNINCKKKRRLSIPDIFSCRNSRKKSSQPCGALKPQINVRKPKDQKWKYFIRWSSVDGELSITPMGPIWRGHGPFSLRVYELMTEISWKYFCVILFLMIQSGHDFAHAMTAELSWHVQNCNLIGSSSWK